MIFDLAQDFNDAVAATPDEHAKHRMLELLEEAIRRDIHFTDRHPTTLFQCMWNSCWWYDCPEAAEHYEEPERGWTVANAPWLGSDEAKLYPLLECWRERRDQSNCSPPWLRSHRPPPLHLGTAQLAVLRGPEWWITSVAYSPGGQRIACGSGDPVVKGKDNSVRIWDAESGTELAALHGHTLGVCGLSYSPDGKRIVSDSADKTMRV